MCAEEFVYLRARTTRAAKVTLISTQQAAAYYDPEKSRGAYPTRDAYLADVVDFTRREVGGAGPPGLHLHPDRRAPVRRPAGPGLREGYRQRGSDPDRLIDACIEMDNAVIDGHPGVTFGLHICRGNNQSHVLRQRRLRSDRARLQPKPLPALPPRVRRRPLGRLRAAARHARRPRGCAGLVTTKKPRLESVDELRRRIDEAATFVPLGRLALSPQCGFASTMAGNRIGPDEQRAKLQRVAETARLVWGA